MSHGAVMLPLGHEASNQTANRSLIRMSDNARRLLGVLRNFQPLLAPEVPHGYANTRCGCTICRSLPQGRYSE